jgi:hypothetical protein
LGVPVTTAKREPNADFYYAPHNLNVALGDCVQNISETRNYHEVLLRLVAMCSGWYEPPFWTTVLPPSLNNITVIVTAEKTSNL